MNRLRRTLEYLWPELLLEGTPWYDEWKKAHREQFAQRCRVFFVLVIIGYVGHYYLVDIPRHKEPIEAWFAFRMTMSALAGTCILFYLNPTFILSRRVKWPAIVVLAIGSHAQAHVAIHFPEAPWIYPYIFVFASAMVLNTSPLKSMFFCVPVFASFIFPLTAAGIPEYQLASASVVCSIIIFVIRASYESEIRQFLLTQERDRYRQQSIDLGKEFEGRLKSFIPKVIYERLDDLIQNTKMTVLEATLDVLTPKKMHVACLWSDIRGFTKQSERIDDFLAESVIPEVKACSDAIESYQGIPRKIGDLIFAYFDDSDERSNLLRSILAGFDLCEVNKDMNATVSNVKVRRYILISSGEALVGNMGGLNSGVEITALGSPVNFLARLDDATKQPGMKKHLEPGDIILCHNSARNLQSMKLGIEWNRICLKTEQVEIRDFEHVDNVYVLKPTQRNQSILLDAHSEHAG